MSRPERASALRLGLGAAALAAGLATAAFILPDASDQLVKMRQAKKDAQDANRRQKDQLAELQRLADRIERDQSTLETLEAHLPRGSAGELQWQLSQVLHDLADKNGVRLTTVKYGAPSREGAKGTDLESVEVEFVVVGVYTQIKQFMLALEGSGLPFAVGDARLEESPEGARLDAVLRAFRRAPSAQDGDA